MVTAVGRGGQRRAPSRFLAELAGDEIEIEHDPGRALRWLSLPALVADLRAGRRRPAAADSRCGRRRGRPAGPAGAGRGPPAPTPTTGTPSPPTRPTVRPADAEPDGSAVRVSPVAGGVVHPLRAALAAGGRRRGGRADVARGTSASSSTRRRCSPPRAPTDGPARRPHRRDLAPPGLRQRLVQRKQRERWPSRWCQVPGLAPGEPAGTGRLRGGVAARSLRSRSPAGWTGWNATPRAGRWWSTSRPVGPRPPDAELDRHPQLGVYQLAVDARRVRAARPDRAGRRGTRPGRQGRPARRPGAGAGRAGRRHGAGLGRGSWSTPWRRAWRGRCSRPR